MKLFLDTDAAPPLFTLSPEESRHAVSVLRLGMGDTLHVTDGRGNLFECRIVGVDSKACGVRVVETFTEFERRPYSLTVAVAPTKNSDRMEWFFEKATEVGVDKIIPIECANSERRVFFKPDRALKIIASATKQSLKTYLPELLPLTPVRSTIEAPFDGVKLIAHCRETPRTEIVKALHPKADTLILIGPEGDFTVEEVALAEKHGFISISLGQSRLRTETAALASVVAVYLQNQK